MALSNEGLTGVLGDTEGEIDGLVEGEVLTLGEVEGEVDGDAEGMAVAGWFSPGYIWPKYSVPTPLASLSGGVGMVPPCELFCPGYPPPKLLDPLILYSQV